MRKLRIGFLLPSYDPESNSQMPIVMRTLADAGVAVDVIRPLKGMLDLSSLRGEHDLYVMKKKSGLALSLAGALHALGATIVNPYPASAALLDKIVTVRILQSAGVPMPPTYVANHPGELAPLLEAGPLVVKPPQGGGGHGG